MTFDGDMVIALTPREMQVFQLVISDSGDPKGSQLLSTFVLPHSVGFAELAFTVEDRYTQPSTHLHLCLSGKHGLYVYAIPRDMILLHNPDLETSLVWSTFTRGQPYQNEENDAFSPEFTRIVSQPHFGTDGTTLAWFEGPGLRAEDGLPFELVISTSRWRGQDITSQSALSSPCYRLSGLGEVACYAEVRFDFDEGLGLLAIGNAFGELALYSVLSPAGMPAVFQCLEQIVLAPWNGTTEILPVRLHDCTSMVFISDNALMHDR